VGCTVGDIDGVYVDGKIEVITVGVLDGKNDTGRDEGEIGRLDGAFEGIFVGNLDLVGAVVGAPIVGVFEEVIKGAFVVGY
jgi:hypothetical protein